MFSPYTLHMVQANIKYSKSLAFKEHTNWFKRVSKIYSKSRSGKILKILKFIIILVHLIFWCHFKDFIILPDWDVV